MLDTIAVTLSALKQLGRAIEHWGDLLIKILTEKLDERLHKKWETQTCQTMPTFSEFEEFPSLQCKMMEACRPNQTNERSSKPMHSGKVLHVGSDRPKCPMCVGDHKMFNCERFLQLDTQRRCEAVRTHRLCYTCLSKGHFTNRCSSNYRCSKCNRKHHLLLHEEVTAGPSTEPEASASVNYATTPASVLLSTCVVNVKRIEGEAVKVRAFLDTGSQLNLITDSCAKRLGLKREQRIATVFGVSASENRLSEVVQLQLSSRVTGLTLRMEAFVIRKICNKVPAQRCDVRELRSNLPLADPQFNTPQGIDLLIGNDCCHQILNIDKVQSDGLTLISSRLGWIVNGQLHSLDREQNVIVATTCAITTDELIAKFWELEHHQQVSLSKVDERCETHFKSNVLRLESGRFEVALPFKEDCSRLGNSSETAKGRFFALERRLAKAPELNKDYRAFIKEYLDLGRMKPTLDDATNGYYLPHHCVLKASSLTTKLRVVFNGSVPSSTGVSLNDILMVGPPIQNDLFSIMIRMRCWRFVVTADIAKMYRQVQICPQDQQYQRIWWRNSASDELVSYELTTVTYETACAAFLAIRALHELAERKRVRFPIGSAMCLSDFYVDDLITGANTLTELKVVRDQVNGLLASGGFELKRWACNNPDLFNDFKTECTHAVTVLTREHKDNFCVSTLGSTWNTKKDTIGYSCNIVPVRANTKRSMLSEVSSDFIPDATPPEVKCCIATAVGGDNILPECSTFVKTVHAMAYIIRFVNNCKGQNIVKGPLTLTEVSAAEIVVLLNVQRKSFARDIEQLKRKQPVCPSSKLHKLNPFLDDKGLIRVGGRLAISEISA